MQPPIASSSNLTMMVTTMATVAEAALDEEREELLRYRYQSYKLVIPIFMLIALAAMLANLVVILALRATKVKSATVSLILNLTISDIWTSFVVAVSLMYNSYLPTVQGTDVNACVSLTLELLRTGGLITGTLHLLLIAIHHYVSIVRPHTSKRQLRRLAQVLCTLAWITPLAVLVLLAVSFPNEGYRNCTNRDMYYQRRVFRYSVSSLLLLIFVAITTCYCRLLWILRTQRRRWHHFHASSANAEEGTAASRRLVATTGTAKAPTTSERRVQRENKTLWTTILICSSFFVGWAPATIHFTITCLTCELLREQRFKTLFMLSCVQLCFILGKSLINPLIYSMRIPEIVAEIRTIRWVGRRTSKRLCGGLRSVSSRGQSTFETCTTTAVRCAGNDKATQGSKLSARLKVLESSPTISPGERKSRMPADRNDEAN